MADEEWYNRIARRRRHGNRSRANTSGRYAGTGREVDCELRFHGESYGWGCPCLHDGEFAYGPPVRTARVSA
jgi:hypothetical protein